LHELEVAGKLSAAQSFSILTGDFNKLACFAFSAKKSGATTAAWVRLLLL
jgi:hypothetical protein